MTWRLLTTNYVTRPWAFFERPEDEAWDVTFLVNDPSRDAVADFSPPYMQSDFTYLVPAGSPIETVAQANQPGMRVAVVRGDASERHLTRVLTQAELARNDWSDHALDLLRRGEADAYATPRVVALALAAKLPGSRVLADSFGVASYVAMVRKGHADRLAYITAFIEQAKASGMVKEIFDRFGLQGFKVAPPDKNFAMTRRRHEANFPAVQE
jgi:polar amino acid transport system substrate-binding protein